MTGINKCVRPRALFFGLIVLILMLMLIIRLFHIQMIRGKNYSQEAIKQRMLNLPLHISRGQFYDINMIPLTGRKRIKNIIVFPKLIECKEEAAAVISKLTSSGHNDALKRLEETTSPYILPLGNEVDKADIANFKGLMIIDTLKRYDEENVARHLIGYIDKSDNVGRSGLERLYEDHLSGDKETTVAAMVDGYKRLIPGLGYKLINAGHGSEGGHIQLTIDYHIQKVVEELMDEHKIEGAVVVLDVETGKIAALASRPNYGQWNVEKYLDGQRGELLNKAFQQYNLGSIFKTVVVAAALEDGLINPFEKVHCPGYVKMGDLCIKCSSYDRGGHGDINMFDAYAKSCNTYFIDIGQRIGGKRVMEMAKQLGFGSPQGVNPLEEQPGLIPSDKTLYRSDMCNISIGQGDIMVTPLQVAVMTNTIANNGIYKRPRIIERLIDKPADLSVASSSEKGRRVIPSFVAIQLKRMMEMVVDSGTGTLASLPAHGGSAGKTSTAQTGQRTGDYEVLHAWFTGYAPRDRPKYVITVLTEDGRSGGSIAAPIFKDIAKRVLALGGI